MSTAAPSPATSPTGRPVHVVPDTDRGAIGMYAREVALAAGAPVLTGSLAELDALAGGRSDAWHVHFCDRLYAATPGEAAERIARWAQGGRLTLTLHDVPQPWASPERQQGYLEAVAAADGWAANSHHEVLLLEEARRLTGAATAPAPGLVAHLPVPDPQTPAAASGEVSENVGDEIVFGVVGWVYPDKGHREVVRAAGRLAEAGHRVRVRCLGAAVEGHADLVEELQGRADRSGVALEVTGFLDQADLEAAMRAVTVPVAAHRHLSASASVNSWLSTGRRPVVADGRYTRELAALRPGTLLLVDADGPEDSGEALDEVVRRVVADPDLTRLAPDARLAPHLGDTVAAYAAWWSATGFDGPHPARPELPAW